MRIIQFFSTSRNIGNYTPVWGIRRMLGPLRHRVTPADVRDCERIDPAGFDLILVGGAGLLNRYFEPFWRWLARQRKPVVLWGIGVCLPHPGTRVGDSQAGGVDPALLRALRSRIVAANVRDELTEEMYDLGADISYCPTAVYLKDRPARASRRRHILCAVHPELVTAGEARTLAGTATLVTDHTVKNRFPGFPLILVKYRRSRLVVTTRLHGAIIANSLGIPYLGFSRDRKLDEYARMYRGGLLLPSLTSLPGAVADVAGGRLALPEPVIDLARIEAFGARVCRLLVPAV